jgi:hypothetical protein
MHMKHKGNDGLPQFPSTPDGVGRKEHLPTVEACIRYWEAVRVNAIRTRERSVELTATALRSSYEQARQELIDAESLRQSEAKRRLRTGRSSPGLQRRDAADEP